MIRTALHHLARIDVRLVLMLAGFVLVSIAGDPLALFDTIQSMFSKGGIIGPICSAMGYAYVLKQTECDKHMVMLLTRPLQRVGWLLIPGGVVAGFFTNMAITSQTASAAALGPILYPILRSAGHSPVVSAATILIGCSVGGNLFNPGEPDIVAIGAATHALTGTVINAALLPNLVALAVATITLVLTSPKPTVNADEHHEQEQVNIVKAIMGPLPVVILLVLQPAIGLAPFLNTRYPTGVHVSMVMVACTGLVMLVTSPGWRGLSSHLTSITVAFFDGMGYAFAKVISIIIAASCFIGGLNAIGALDALSDIMGANSALAVSLAPLLTWIMAAVGGSGTAPSVAFSQAMLPDLAAQNVDTAVNAGVAAAIGANVGRTMSPVAAVVLFSSALSDVPVVDLLRKVAPCMIASVIATMLLGLILHVS